MSKKSKINIFNVMTEDELDNNLKNPDYSRREYQRLIAMKLIAFGISHTDVAKIIGVSYKTINRWARNCSYEGIDGLMPEFNGGRPSKLSNMQKLEFGNILFLSEGLSMMDARQILIDKFGVEYSLTQVAKITDKLGFNYSTSRPEFIESPKNKEEILINTLEEAEITENDIIVNVDESRMKKEIRSPKGFKLKGDKKKRQKITKETISANFMCVLGLNVESFLFKINNLTSLEFAKSLLKIRELYCDSDELSEIFNNVIDNYDLTKKEIRKILEETEEYNEDFIPKLERSIKSNKKDNTNALSRKLGKICKRESTENPKKQENIRINHVYSLILENNLDEICNKLPRIVMILDNPKAHKTDFVRDIAKLLNIYLLQLPPYSPELAPVEIVFKIIKHEFRKKILKTKDEIIDFCLEIFESKCKSNSLCQWFVKKYIPIIC